MKNGKPSLIFDIRYFSGSWSSYLKDHSITAYGRRLAWYLNSEGVSLGAYHSVYIHFTATIPAGEIEIDPYKGGDELWWLRHTRVGVPPEFPSIERADEFVMQGTVAALRESLPNEVARIDQADRIVREHADGLRFLIREKEYRRYSLKFASTIAAHPEPSHLYVTVIDNATGIHCETPGLPVGWYVDAFDDAASVSLKDLEITHSADGRLEAVWSQRVRGGWIVDKSRVADQQFYSKLVRRQ